MRIRVYLDACAIQRPLDVLSTASLRLEAAAIDVVFAAVAVGEFELVWSPALEYECIVRSPPVRARYAEVARSLSHVYQDATAVETRRVRELIAAVKLSELDALHAACAEASSATFVTVDRRLIRRLRRTAVLRVDVLDPIEAIARIRSAQ